MKLCISILLIAFAMVISSSAYWPTTVENNLAVAADPDTFETGCFAFPFTDNSTLIIFKSGWTGGVYQIIDKYGELRFSYQQPLAPLLIGYPLQKLIAIPDGEGGAFACWTSWDDGDSMFAQHIDSLGNITWGDSGACVFPISDEPDFDICIDGEGGMYLAISIEEPEVDYDDLWLQRIDSEGNPLWGSQGIQVSAMPSQCERYSSVVPNGSGGAFVVWEDHRDPFTWGARFAQHIDGEGNHLWQEDLFICEEVYGDEMIPDGEGGFIFQANPNGDYNTHWRIDGNGNILWERNYLSWWYSSDMVLGESGFFYLGFWYGYGNYGQRVDIEGNNYWPTWGSGQPGALMSYFSGWQHAAHERFAYRYPFFYGVLDYNVNSGYPTVFYGQALDSLGNRMMGENGVLMCSIDEGYYQNTHCVPDGNNGVVLVFEHVYYYNVWAKRADMDGSLGGPSPVLVSLNPFNPPILIPANGGTFEFNIALDNLSESPVDIQVWTMATLPNGSEYGPIIGPVELSLIPGYSGDRDRWQNIPARAPAGDYIYDAYVGSYPDERIAESHFDFTKLADTAAGGFEITDWNCGGEGFEGEMTQPQAPQRSVLYSPNPNPFNVKTVIGFELRDEGEVILIVYDVQGREIQSLVTGHLPPGYHEAVWDAEDFSSGMYFIRLTVDSRLSTVKKIVLMK